MRQSSVVAISEWRQDRHPQNAADRSEGYWPEVSSHCPGQLAGADNSANSQKRVLLEVFLVLAGAGMMAAAAAIWLPVPS